MNELKKANIQESWWSYCRIENGIIITPSISEQLEYGLITEEEYKCIVGEQINICHEPTVEEKVIILEKTIANLEIELLKIK